MGAAAILQIVAKNAEDSCFIINPEVTFFKIIYKRHTNFSIEPVYQNLNNDEFAFGTKYSCILNKNSDLIHKIYIDIELPELPKIITDISNDPFDIIKKYAWVRDLGFAIIKNVSISIGGEQIVSHTGEYMYIESELYGKNKKSLDKMIGNIDELINYTEKKDKYILKIPLYFWFCKYISQSLPILCLKFHEVKISFELSKLKECLLISPSHSIQMKNEFLHYDVGDYIYQNADNLNGSNIGAKGEFVLFNSINKRMYYNKLSEHKFMGMQTLDSGRQSLDSTYWESNNIEYNLNSEYYKIYKYNPDNTQMQIYGMPADNAVENKETSKIYRDLSTIKINNIRLDIQHIYLDEYEREKFLSNDIEYLFEELQISNTKILDNTSVKLNLPFINLCKTFYWVSQLLDIKKYSNNKFNYSDLPFTDNDGKYYGNNLIKENYIEFSGNNRVDKLDSLYYTNVQRLNYCTNAINRNKYIHMFNFGLFNNSTQPAGSINCTLFNNIKLGVEYNKLLRNYSKNLSLVCYAVSYNILTFKYGLARKRFQ